MQSLFAKLMSDDPAFRARADRLVARAGDLSHSEAPAMRVALESARAGAPSGDFRAEAVIMLDLRPSLLVADASVEIPDDEEWRAAIGKAEPVVKALTPRVGHIRLSVFGVDKPLGTGWALDDKGTLITNRHVARHFAIKQGDEFGLIPDPSTGQPTLVKVDFNGERGARLPELAAVVKVRHVEGLEDNSGPDIAVLTLEGDIPLEPFRLYDGDIDIKRPVGTIGFPTRDIMHDQASRKKIFGDAYDVKRFAPGYLRNENAGVEWAIAHDCSTLAGASGSPVFDLETGGVVGVHFAGQFNVMNLAVTRDAFKDVLAKRAIAIPVVLPDPAPEPEPDPATPAVDPCAPFAIPLNPGDEAAGAARKPKGDSGYDSAFLGAAQELAVPAPNHDRLGANALLAAPDGGVLFGYTHYSLAMHAARRLAAFTACNIDGGALRRMPRPRGWALDARMPAAAQCGPELYTNNDFDRGHLVRRLDPVWGTKKAAEAANEDTFFYTNAAPQHKDLNQRVWLDLEDYILDQTSALGLKVSVFTGPVFDPGDPAHRGVQIPRRFWKIVAWAADDGAGPELRAAAYLLDQTHLLQDLRGESAFGAFGAAQVSVALVGAMTKLEFGPLEGADVLLRRMMRGGLEAATPSVRPLRSVEDSLL